MSAMPLSSRLLAVAVRLREEAGEIKEGRGTPCSHCSSKVYTAAEVASFKLKRNLAETADKLERLAKEASKIGVE